MCGQVGLLLLDREAGEDSRTRGAGRILGSRRGVFGRCAAIVEQTRRGRAQAQSASGRQENGGGWHSIRKPTR